MGSAWQASRHNQKMGDFSDRFFESRFIQIILIHESQTIQRKPSRSKKTPI